MKDFYVNCNIIMNCNIKLYFCWKMLHQIWKKLDSKFLCFLLGPDESFLRDHKVDFGIKNRFRIEIYSSKFQRGGWMRG